MCLVPVQHCICACQLQFCTARCSPEEHDFTFDFYYLIYDVCILIQTQEQPSLFEAVQQSFQSQVKFSSPVFALQPLIRILIHRVDIVPSMCAGKALAPGREHCFGTASLAGFWYPKLHSLVHVVA